MITTRPTRVQRMLREGTAAAHRELDHHPLLQRLTSNHLTRVLYAESLAAMHLPHLALERQVHRSAHHAHSGLNLSARVLSLEADLDALGWPVASIPAAPPDRTETRAAWWGRVYVLEGSRLGGAVIARCIRSNLGESAPCRFFGAAPQAQVQQAVQAMRERELAGDDDLARAVASARAAFAAYRSALEAFDGAARDPARCLEQTM